MYGFDDELDQEEEELDFKLLERAYNIGRNHALIGDEIKYIDILSNKEILKLIKKL